MMYPNAQCHLMFVFRYRSKGNGIKGSGFTQFEIQVWGLKYLPIQAGKEYAKEYRTICIFRLSEVSFGFRTLNHKFYFFESQSKLVDQDKKIYLKK